MSYHILIEKRKDVAVRMEELTGEKPSYTGVPRCAYILRGITLEKNNRVVTDDDADMELISRLIEEGLIEPSEEADEEAEATKPTADEGTALEAEGNTEGEGNSEDDLQDGEPEAVKLAISFPLGRHRAESICNLVFTIYSKGSLLSKATGGTFHATDGLVERLQSGKLIRIEETLEIIRDAGEDALTGLAFEEDKVVFNGFPETTDEAVIRAWTALASAINKAAISQNHVRAKRVDETNEKFAFRTWLTRIGMNGSDLKQERSILYTNLSGHTAFRTSEDQEKWTRRQNEKRESFRKLKEAALKESQRQESAEQEGNEEPSGAEE